MALNPMAIHPVDYLKTNPFVLAPMAGITDCAFRSFMREQGAGVVVSELVSATGLNYNSSRTKELTRFSQAQRPVGIQLFGEEILHLVQAAKWVEEQGADFVDLNFGCPVPKVVKKGAGSAMLKDLPQMRLLLRAIVKELRIPLTIKIRTGWDANTRNAHEVLQIAADEGVAWVAIHGRTRAQGYSGLADWDYIGEVKAKAAIPVLGNGDIVTPQQALARMRTFGLDGVLIGRGCLKNPQIFKQAHGLWLQSRGDSSAASLETAVTLWDVYLALSKHLVQNCEERILQIQLKKFAAWFASGYPGAAQFRKNVFQLPSNQEILDYVQIFFSELSLNAQADTSQEAFLMGGHG